MNTTTFERLFEEQVNRSRSILVSKAKEYATEDRLHNFKVAATLEGKTPEQALAGMMAKHTVSIYDMAESGRTYPIELWQEKITDHINYLFLLNAIVRECPHIRALAAADRDGRLIVKRKPIEATCGSCIHFHPEPNRSSGPCTGGLTKQGKQRYVAQSRKACRGDYKNREEVEEP